MDDSVEARRQRIAQARAARKARAAGQAPPGTPAHEPVTPVTPPQPISVDDEPLDAVVVKRVALPQSQSPATKRSRKEEMLYQSIAALPSEVRSHAERYLATLLEHGTTVRSMISEIREEIEALDEDDRNYGAIKALKGKDIEMFVNVQTQLADERTRLRNGIIPAEFGTYIEQMDEKFGTQIRNVNRSRQDHETQAMSLRDIEQRRQNEQDDIVQITDPLLNRHPRSLYSPYASRVESLLDQRPAGLAALPAPMQPRPSSNVVPLPPLLPYRRPTAGSSMQGERGEFNPYTPRDPLQAPPTAERSVEDLNSMIDHAHIDIEPMDLPKEMDVTSLEHQRQGLAWLVKQERSKYRGGILADDMGLGKTVQTIALTYANPPAEDAEPRHKLTLIVCPLTLVSTWHEELKNRVHPQYRHGVYVHNSSINKSAKFTTTNDIPPGTRYVLTTYETLAIEFKHRQQKTRKPTPLLNVSWYRVVLDEAHFIKNRSSKRSLACAELSAQYRLCLSGTPMQNNLEELWPLLRFLRFEPYGHDLLLFKRLCPSTGATTTDLELDIQEKLQKLQLLLANVLLRRTKDTKINGVAILSNLPAKTNHEIMLDMSTEERKSYLEFEGSTVDKAQTFIKERDGGELVSCFLVLLLRLRQRSCHPMLSTITSEVWAPVPPKQTVQHVELLDGMDPVHLRKAVEGTDENHFESDVDAPFMRKCTGCAETIPLGLTVVLVNCGHLLCPQCFQSLPKEYPSTTRAEMGVCPVCSELANPTAVALQLAQMVLHQPRDRRLGQPQQDRRQADLAAKYAQFRNRTSSDWRLLRRQKQDELERYLQSHDTTDIFADSDDSDEFDLEFGAMKSEQLMIESASAEPEQDPVLNVSPAAEPGALDTYKPDENPLEFRNTMVYGLDRTEWSRDEDLEAAPEVVVSRFEQLDNIVESAPVTEPKQEIATVKDESTKKEEPMAPKQEAASSESPDSSEPSGKDETVSLMSPSRSSSPEPECLSGDELREKAKTRYKANVDEVARLFYRSKCFSDHWTSSTKVDAALETLFDIWSTRPNDKVIIFSFFTSFLDVMTIPLNAARIKHVKFTGEMDANERTRALQTFSSTSAKVLLISLRAGNVGLTLTDANHVFIMEPFWNPYVEEQAKDRVHRIGQRKKVGMYRFVCKGTVEDRIVELQNKKKEMIESALSKEAREGLTRLSKSDLLFALGLGRRGPPPTA